MKKEFAAIFDWTGLLANAMPDKVRKDLEELYVLCYNHFCNMTNKLLPIWNAQWETGKDYYEAEGFEYDSWMQNNYKSVISKGFENPIFDFDIGDECQFIAIIKQPIFKGVSVTFHLEEM